MMAAQGARMVVVVPALVVPAAQRTPAAAPLRPAAATARVCFPARASRNGVLRSQRTVQMLQPLVFTIVSDATKTDSAVLRTRSRCVTNGGPGNCLH